MSVTSKESFLSFIKTDDAILMAKQLINRERSGEQYGLYTRFKSLNRAVIKYMRFDQIYLIAGRSGSGKSAILTMMRNDFLNIEDTRFTNVDHIYLGEDSITIPSGKYAGCQYYPHSRMVVDIDETYFIPAINKGCKYDVMVMHFGPEMAPEVELIRSASSIVGKSFTHIMSSEFDYETNSYKRLSDSEYESISEALDSLKGRKEYYVPISGNLVEMTLTVEKAVERNPGHKLVVTVDHSLLIKRMYGQSEGDLIEAIALWAVYIRQKYEAMVIILNQLNNEIERVDRTNKPDGHYPRKLDIHFGSKLWWAADNVIIFHRPEQLGITSYGQYGLNTTNLIHGYLIKSRNGDTGNIYLKAAFEYGRILEAKKADFT